MGKIVVAMSGGVDSTVSAYLLQQQGHEIIGVYMRLHDNENSHEENISKITKVANFLNIPFHVLDLRDKFRQEVYGPFVSMYQQGLTPNPCALCNKQIKMGSLVEFAKKLEADKLATGHYARLQNNRVKEAFDQSKDQSYFMAQVDSDSLSFMIFPLGDKLKTQVKEIAKNIPILEEFATQKESSEICFVPKTYVEILNKHLKVDLPGNVLDINRNIVGKHQGYMHYTIGKRRGFEVRGAHDAHYVVKIDAQKNEIIVGSKDDLKTKEFFVKDVNFMKNESLCCEVKVRYRSPKMRCQLIVDENSNGKVVLEESLEGLAPGQMAAFYNKDILLGGAWIVR